MKPILKAGLVSICALVASEALAGTALAARDDAITSGVTATEHQAAATPVAAAPSFGVVLPIPRFPFSYKLPGQFAFKTTRGFYLTALSGGGLVADPTVVTASTNAGSWEQFRIVVNPANAWDKSFQTMNGHFVTAVNGGGMTSNAFHTDATAINGWEQFRMNDLSQSGFAPTWYALGTIGGRVVTAVGAGGHYLGAIHTDGYLAGAWEEFRPVKCGDLGSGYNYYILPANLGRFIAPNGGGHADEDNALVTGYSTAEPDNAQWSRFKLIRQSDGTYGLQTSNGVNYVTALFGGGISSVYEACDPGFPGACISGSTGIFHTDATEVRGWEKYNIIDQGNCKYAIQTSKGFFIGSYQNSDGVFLTTARTSISSSELFEFVMSDLGSPPIFH